MRKTWKQLGALALSFTLALQPCLAYGETLEQTEKAQEAVVAEGTTSEEGAAVIEETIVEEPSAELEATLAEESAEEGKTDQEVSEEISEDAALTGDYTLTYNANGGSGAPSRQTNSGNTMISSQIPAREGYDFQGWSTSDEAGFGYGDLLGPGDYYDLEEDTTLYARWIEYGIVPADIGYVTFYSHIYSNKASRTRKFTPAKTMTVRFESQSDYDTLITLMDENFKVLKEDDDSGSGKNFCLEYEFEAGKTYYISTEFYGKRTGKISFTGQRLSTISYDSKGGSITPDPVNVYSGDMFVITSDIPTKSYKVTFNANGGTCSKSSMTKKVSVLHWLEDWQDADDEGYAPGEEVECTGNMKMVAVYGKTTYGTLPTPTRSGYTFSGWYTAKSGGSKVTSSSALTKNITLYARWKEAGPDITKQPIDCEVNENNTAVFEVAATGTGLTYQWQYMIADGTKWSNCTSATKGYNTAKLSVVSELKRNGYRYRCVITDSNGKSVTSDVACLMVVPFAIAIQPKDVKAGVGDTAIFECNATGVGLAYQWQYRTSATSSWQNCTSKTEGYNDYMLQVAATTARNGYQYRCIIKEPLGNTLTSKTVTLTVAASPVIVVQPVSQTVAYDTHVYFNCKGSGPGITYQWQYRTSSTASWKNCTSATIGYNEETLIVLGTAARNGYQYHCIVTDKNGNKKTSSTVTLKTKKWEIIASPVNNSGTVGELVPFSIETDGNYWDYTFQWQYKTSSTASWKNCSSKTQGYDDFCLMVEATAARDGYQYRCIVTDQKGRTLTSSAAKLSVVDWKITTQPSIVTVNEGETAVFKVKATGTGLTYQWQYCTFNQYGIWKNCTSKTKGYNTATLSVEATIARHEYMYRCIVTDSKGNSRVSDYGVLVINGMGLG